MKKAIKNIALIFVVAVLVVATGGFSIYRHICNCAGEESSSIFLEADCGNALSNSQASCCEIEEVAACCQTETKQQPVHQCHGEDCCNTESQFFKINDLFQPGIEKLSIKPVVIAHPVLYVEITEDELTLPASHIYNYDLPPPDSGRQLLLALHQLKLDPALS